MSLGIGVLIKQEQADLRALNEALSGLTKPFEMEDFESSMIKAYFDVFKAYLYLASDAAAQGRGSDERERLQNASAYGAKIGLYVPAGYSFLIEKNLGLPRQDIDRMIALNVEERANKLATANQPDLETLEGKALYLEESAKKIGEAAVFYGLAGGKIAEEKVAPFYTALKGYFDQIISDLKTIGAPTIPQANPTYPLKIGKKLEKIIKAETGDAVEIEGKLCDRIYCGFSEVLNESFNRASELMKDEKSREAAVQLIGYARAVAKYIDVSTETRERRIRTLERVAA